MLPAAGLRTSLQAAEGAARAAEGRAEAEGRGRTEAEAAAAARQAALTQVTGTINTCCRVPYNWSMLNQ